MTKKFRSEYGFFFLVFLPEIVEVFFLFSCPIDNLFQLRLLITALGVMPNEIIGMSLIIFYANSSYAQKNCDFVFDFIVWSFDSFGFVANLVIKMAVKISVMIQAFKIDRKMFEKIISEIKGNCCINATESEKHDVHDKTKNSRFWRPSIQFLF